MEEFVDGAMEARDFQLVLTESFLTGGDKVWDCLRVVPDEVPVAGVGEGLVCCVFCILELDESCATTGGVDVREFCDSFEWEFSDFVMAGGVEFCDSLDWEFSDFVMVGGVEVCDSLD